MLANKTNDTTIRVERLVFTVLSYFKHISLEWEALAATFPAAISLSFKNPFMLMS
jgi:hypothetical protein